MRLRLRYDGTCQCGAAVPAGTAAGYDRTTKKAVCPSCPDTPMPAAEPVLDTSPDSTVPSPAGSAAQVSPSPETTVVATGRPVGRPGLSATGELLAARSGSVRRTRGSGASSWR